MPMAGKGMLLTSMDVDAAHDAEFNRWYDREHIEERVAIPGFLEARRYVAHDGKPLTPKKGKKDAEPAAAATQPAPAPVTGAPTAPAAAPAPLDQRGTRRAPRFIVTKGIEVTIDGNPAALINLSVVGAQVVSPTILKPNQRVRMTLPDTEGPIRVMAGVAWAAFEMPKTGPVYRAGIEFYDAEATPVLRFIDTNKVS